MNLSIRANSPPYSNTPLGTTTDLHWRMLHMCIVTTVVMADVVGDANGFGWVTIA
jgi:hypothetical protein